MPMDERVMQFRVGVVVLATAIILAILIILFQGKPTVLRPHFMLTIRLPEAPGIVADSPVRQSGITIGRVRSVKFTDDGLVEVTAAIETKYRLAKNLQCRVKGTLLGGDASLDFIPKRELAPGEADLGKQYYENGDILTGRAAVDPLEIIGNLGESLGDLPDALKDLPGAISSVSKAGDQVALLAERLNALVPDDTQKIRRALEQSEEALAGVAKVADMLEAVLGDPQVQASVREGLTELPTTLSQVRTAMAGIEKAANVAQQDLASLQEVIQPFGEVMKNANSGLDDLSEIFAQVQLFVESLNDRKGTVGQLLHNPQLYENLNQSVTNIEELSRQLRPILSDVRVFTDKIARDPGRLGVRGVLRQPGGLK